MIQSFYINEFNPNSIKVFGKKVALKLIDKNDKERCDGGIYIPESNEANNRLGKYEVISVGNIAYEEYGIEVGDYVYADRLSVFYDTKPICVMNYENIIVKSDKVWDEIFPFNDMMFIIEDEIKDDEYLMNNIYMPKLYDSNRLPIGTIIKINIKSKKYVDDYKVGDKILLTKGPDVCIINGIKFRIYKCDMLIAKVEK